MRLILSGNSGDSLAEHRDMPFTTRDQDNDISETNINCAIKLKEPGGTRGVTNQISMACIFMEITPPMLME